MRKKSEKKRGHHVVTKKIRGGDQVIAIAGNYKGQVGTVLKIEGERAVVKGINVGKKHTKPTQLNPKGAISEIEKPIHVSNLMPCLDDGTPVKLKCKELKTGERQLVYKAGGKEAVRRTLRKAKTKG